MNDNQDMAKKETTGADGRSPGDLHTQAVSRLKRFAGLDFAGKVLLFRALFLVIAIRLGLFFLPFRVLKRLTKIDNHGSNAAHSVGQYVWAVRAVSRFVLGATCLTQALAAQALLTASGHDSRIEFAVKKDKQGRFLAHAWVVHDERIVIGGAEADGYLPLETWKTKASGLEEV